jgi:cell division protein FtsI (penicillin-binding protein 3)
VGLHVGNFELSMKRIRALFIILLIVFSLFAARLVQIQGIQSAEYTLKAANEMESTRVIAAPRGDITDINGVAFARSVSAINIVVDQKLIKYPARVAAFGGLGLRASLRLSRCVRSGSGRWRATRHSCGCERSGLVQRDDAELGHARDVARSLDA